MSNHTGHASVPAEQVPQMPGHQAAEFPSFTTYQIQGHPIHDLIASITQTLSPDYRYESLEILRPVTPIAYNGPLVEEGFEVRYPWKPEYAIGVRQIDQQHRRLLDYLNEIDLHQQAGSPPAEINVVVYELLDFVHEHFLAEARLMQKHGLTEAASHIANHERQLVGLRQFVEGRVDQATLTEFDLQYLYGIVCAHIFNDDKEMGQALNKHGVR